MTGSQVFTGATLGSASSASAGSNPFPLPADAKVSKVKTRVAREGRSAGPPIS
jgi:hypothetical protein